MEVLCQGYPDWLVVVSFISMTNLAKITNLVNATADCLRPHSCIITPNNSNYTVTQFRPSLTITSVSKSTNRSSAAASRSDRKIRSPESTDPPVTMSARFIRSVPPIVYQCESQPVTFLWIYETDGMGTPSLIIWRFSSPIDKVDYTLMKHTPEGLFKYGVYQDRAEFYYNAGFKLNHISLADEGPYTVEVMFDTPGGPSISLTNSTQLRVYPRQGCPVYAKYPNFTLTASERVIGIHEVVGQDEPLTLACDIPPSDPDTTARLYWRATGSTDNVYFASCQGSSQPCSGRFTVTKVHLATDKLVVYVGVSYKYQEVDPVVQEDWIMVTDSMERSKQDGDGNRVNRVVASVCLLTIGHLAVILPTRLLLAK